MGDWSLRKTHSFQTWCQKTIVSIFGDAVAKVPLSDPVIVDLMFFLPTTEVQVIGRCTITIVTRLGPGEAWNRKAFLFLGAYIGPRTYVVLASCS